MHVENLDLFMCTAIRIDCVGVIRQFSLCACRLGGGVAQKVVAAGMRCIVSNQEKWYLDHLDVPWQKFYMNEPLTNISTPEQQKLVIGGEVCMWGESIDASDIEQTIWPRAAAAAGNTGEN